MGSIMQEAMLATVLLLLCISYTAPSFQLPVATNDAQAASLDDDVNAVEVARKLWSDAKKLHRKLRRRSTEGNNVNYAQTTTAEMVEVANSAASWSQLQDLLQVYFYSWQLQSLEAVIIYLLLHYFILWRDRSKRREDRLAFEEHIERLKIRVAELEKKQYESQTEIHQMKAELEERREPDPEIMRPMKQVQGWRPEHGNLLCAHDEHINNQGVFDCGSLAQRMSALEERIEQLNDRMRELEEKLEENYMPLSRQQSTSTDEDTDPDSLTPPHPQTVENCCAPSIFLHGELVYEYPHVSACPLHQDVSPHTGTVLSVEQQ